MVRLSKVFPQTCFPVPVALPEILRPAFDLQAAIQAHLVSKQLIYSPSSKNILEQLE